MGVMGSAGRASIHGCMDSARVAPCSLTRSHAHMHTRANTDTDTPTPTRAHTDTHVQARARTHARLHAPKLTNTHARTHARARVRVHVILRDESRLCAGRTYITPNPQDTPSFCPAVPPSRGVCMSARVQAHTHTWICFLNKQGGIAHARAC